MANCHYLSGLSVQCTGRCGSIECLFLNHWTIRRPLAGRDQKALLLFHCSQLSIPEDCLLVFHFMMRDVALGWFNLNLVNLSKVDWTWFALIPPENRIYHTLAYALKIRSWKVNRLFRLSIPQEPRHCHCHRSAECHHRDWMAKFGACLLHEPRSREVEGDLANSWLVGWLVHWGLLCFP